MGEYKKTMNKIKRLYLYIVSLFVLLGLFVVYNLVKTNSSNAVISTKNIEIQNLVEENRELNAAIADNVKIINNLNKEIDNLNRDIDNLNKEIDNITKAANELPKVESELELTKSKLDNALNKLEAYEKYSYVTELYGKKTDVTIDDIMLGKNLMEEKGYDPHLLFGIICLESNGDYNCYNTKSGASGLCQFLSGTGKFVYEDLLGNGKGTYDHSTTPFDGQTNIKMAVAYLDYLYKEYNGDIIKVLMNYSGRDRESVKTYINACNKYINTEGVDIYNMSVTIND